MSPIIESPSPSTSPPAKRKLKKSVSFRDHSLEEIIEFEDDLESKNARKLFWEFMAVDRFRFKDRIERMEPLISPVLCTTHRHGIFTDRMSSFSPPPPPLIPLSSSTLPEGCHAITVEVKMEVEAIVETVVKKYAVSNNLCDAGNSSIAA